MSNPPFKKARFLGSSLNDIREFPFDAQRDLGLELTKIQFGGEAEDWKPMPSIGAGVCEIRTRVASGAYRTIFVAKFVEAVYVLHAFQKKTQKTPQKEIELARKRYSLIKNRE